MFAAAGIAEGAAGLTLPVLILAVKVVLTHAAVELVTIRLEVSVRLQHVLQGDRELSDRGKLPIAEEVGASWSAKS
jgi:hypothetical protein